jgi:hypothetical protein
MHLLTKGFMEDYMCWYAHGELFVPDESMEEQVVGSTSSASNMCCYSIFDPTCWRRCIPLLNRVYEFSSYSPKD